MVLSRGTRLGPYARFRGDVCALRAPELVVVHNWFEDVWPLTAARGQ